MTNTLSWYPLKESRLRTNWPKFSPPVFFALLWWVRKVSPPSKAEPLISWLSLALCSQECLYIRYHFLFLLHLSYFYWSIVDLKCCFSFICTAEWFSLFLIFIFTLFCFTVLYWFCHTLTWISHGCTWVSNPEPPSHLPPHIISLDHPRTPAPSILYPVSNIDWQFISYLIVYMFQCHSPKSSHPLPLPQSLKDCSIHLCLFCCLAYRVIITISL